MKIEHIGIVVRDLERAEALYRALFPEAEFYSEPVADGSMKMLIIKGDNIKLELMQPLIEDSPTGKFLAKKGEGMHHIAYQVDDIEQAMQQAKQIGLQVLTEKPYVGAEQNLVCFIHPKDTFSTLSEFCQCQCE